MSIVSEAIWAASPTTARGLPTPLSTDAKGQRIAYASNKSIFLRSIDQPEICSQYILHTAQTTVARFAPSGFYVASGDVSGTVRVWDCVGEGATKGEYQIISGRINDIAWDGDSQRIIAVGDGKQRFGHCITADSGNSVGEISGQSSQINCVSIRQQRPLRAATGSDDTSIAFYHGAPFKFNTSLRGHHNRFVYGTAFSPDGSTLVTVGADKKIWLFDGKTGEVKGQIGDGEHTGSIFGVSWSSDSKNFATASADQTVKIWDVEAGKATQTWRMGDEGVMSPSHHQLGITWPAGRSDGLIMSVDLDGNLNYFSQGTPSKPTKVVRGNQRNVTAIGLTSDSSASKTLWTGSADGRVRAWDISTGLASAIDGQGHKSYVSSFASSGGGGSAHMYSVGWDDTLRTIDMPSKTFTGDAGIKTAGQPKGNAMLDEDTVVVATTEQLTAYVAAKEVASLSVKGFNITCVAASSAAGVIAVGCDDKSVRIYGLSGSALSLKAEFRDGLASNPNTLAFPPAGTHLAVGMASGGISVYKAGEWSLVTNRWSAHASRVTSIAWSPDGRHAASGALDTHVFAWSLASPGVRVKGTNAHKDGVSGVVWVEGSADEGAKVISTGADAAVKVWTVKGLS